MHYFNIDICINGAFDAVHLISELVLACFGYGSVVLKSSLPFGIHLFTKIQNGAVVF